MMLSPHLNYQWQNSTGFDGVKEEEFSQAQVGSERGYLFVEQDDEAEFGCGDFCRHVDAYLAALDNMLPAGAETIDGKVEAFNAGGDLGWRSGHVVEFEAREGALDQFRDEPRRADLGQLGNIRNQVRFADGGLNLKDPAAGAYATLVGDCTGEEERLHLLERNADGLGGQHDFEMTPDVLIERGETGSEIPVVIGGQITGVNFEPEGAKRARHA